MEEAKLKPELAVVDGICSLLDGLSNEAQARILRIVAERLGEWKSDETRTWADMNAAVRRDARTLTRADVPVAAGVYAWYRHGAAIYVGKADSLRARIWSNHLGTSRSLTSSSFRRNVAAHLGFASAAAIKAGKFELTQSQLDAVRGFILECQVAWLVCASNDAALALETALKRERKPPLTKM